MKVKRILLGLATASLVLGFTCSTFAAEHVGQMDCDAMFKKAEQMLSEDQDASTEEKAKKYALAARAYEKCKKAQKDMQEAEAFFKKVFERKDRM